MTKIITQKDLETNTEFYINEMLKGKIFIFPTDTIYGIGCIATNSIAIRKIKHIKQRDYEKPLAIIPPTLAWILQNCEPTLTKKQLNEGQITYVLKLKYIDSVAKEEIIPNTNNIGIRISKHWFTKYIEKLGQPFVATSVNHSGEHNIIHTQQIPKDILNKTDYIVEAGTLNNKASKIIRINEYETEILRE